MLIYIILAAVFFALVLTIIKLSSQQIHPLLGSALFPIFALIVQSIAIIIAKVKGVNLLITQKGIWFSALGGLFLGLYAIFLFLALSKFGVTKVTPAVYVGAILISFAIGIFFFKESFNWINILGLAFAVVGLILLFLRF